MKKSTINSRDAEDMVKIILADAIELERERVAKLYLKEPMSGYDMKNEIAKMAFKASIWRTCADLRLRTTSGIVVTFCRNGMLEGEKALKWSAEIDVEVTDFVMKKAIGMNDVNAKLEERFKAENELLDALRKKLEDYKNLAARFRLGFTGNPLDRTVVSVACKDFILKKEK